jgi:hypothetical protein
MGYNGINHGMFLSAGFRWPIHSIFTRLSSPSARCESVESELIHQNLPPQPLQHLADLASIITQRRPARVGPNQLWAKAQCAAVHEKTHPALGYGSNFDPKQ